MTLPFPSLCFHAESDAPASRTGKLSTRRLAATLPIVCAIALGAGCTTFGQRATKDQPGAEQANAAAATRPYHETIAIDGRLSVRYQQNGQDEALHGSFGWRQDGDRTLIEMRSPVGQTVAAIDVGPAAATLKQAGQPQRQATDVDALTADALGWPLPVAGMRDWLQGFGVDAGGQRFVASPTGPRHVTTNNGWRITYDAWQQEPGGLSRPRRLDLERDTAQAGPVALRIVIDQWQPR